MRHRQQLLGQQVRLGHRRVLQAAARADGHEARGRREGRDRREGHAPLDPLLGLHEVRLHPSAQQARGHEGRHRRLPLDGDGDQGRRLPQAGQGDERPSHAHGRHHPQPPHPPFHPRDRARDRLRHHQGSLLLRSFRRGDTRARIRHALPRRGQAPALERDPLRPPRRPRRLGLQGHVLRGKDGPGARGARVHPRRRRRIDHDQGLPHRYRDRRGRRLALRPHARRPGQGAQALPRRDTQENGTRPRGRDGHRKGPDQDFAGRDDGLLARDPRRVPRDPGSLQRDHRPLGRYHPLLQGRRHDLRDRRPGREVRPAQERRADRLRDERGLLGGHRKLPRGVGPGRPQHRQRRGNRRHRAVGPLPAEVRRALLGLHQLGHPQGGPAGRHPRGHNRGHRLLHRLELPQPGRRQPLDRAEGLPPGRRRQEQGRASRLRHAAGQAHSGAAFT